MWLTFDHACADAVLRDRRLGRIWKDREPVDRFEPFNLLHRNQMMENEPPAHTRLRRLVARAFARGHVERLRPRVRELAAQLLGQVDSHDFDVIREYAEPLPVLVIAELLGVPSGLAPQLREWSQAIVKMYEVSPTREIEDAAIEAAKQFASTIRDIAWARADSSEKDLISDLVAAREGSARLSEDEVVASAVLLLNAGHEASVNVFGNGLVSMLQRRLAPETRQVELCVEEMLRFDPAVFDDADSFVTTRDPNPHLAFGAGVHFCLGAPLARMELVESLTHLYNELPGLHLVGDPASRGTFVLRGYTAVRVSA